MCGSEQLNNNEGNHPLELVDFLKVNNKKLGICSFVDNNERTLRIIGDHNS